MKSADVLFLAIIVMLHGVVTAPTVGQMLGAAVGAVVLVCFSRQLRGHWG